MVKYTKGCKISVIIISILLFANIAFIWGNSLPDKMQSRLESENVQEIVRPILEPVVGEGNVTDTLVRKLAHFIEFGALGCELAVLLILCGRLRIQSLANSIFFSMTVALIDETIQIFSGRGSQIQDVWLDAAGAVTGLGVALLLFFAVRKLRVHR